MLRFQFAFSAILLTFSSWSQMAIAIPNVTSLLSSLHLQVKREAVHMLLLSVRIILSGLSWYLIGPNSVAGCYGLNVCIPQKFICRSLHSQCDDIWRWGFSKVIRFRWGHDFWNSMTGIQKDRNKVTVVYGLNEHSFANERVADRGDACTTGINWTLLGKQIYRHPRNKHPACRGSSS